MDVTAALIVAALIVAASSTLCAIYLARQANTQRRAERAEDFAHQDQLAEKASEQTRRLIETNEKIARRTDETARAIEGKLDVVHGLVNSGLTAAKQSELDAVERDLASLKEIVAIHRGAGREPDPATVDSVAQAERRAADLRAELIERRAADAVAHVRAEANEAREDRDRRGG